MRPENDSEDDKEKGARASAFIRTAEGAPPPPQFEGEQAYERPARASPAGLARPRGSANRASGHSRQRPAYRQVCCRHSRLPRADSCPPDPPPTRFLGLRPRCLQRFDSFFSLANTPQLAAGLFIPSTPYFFDLVPYRFFPFFFSFLPAISLAFTTLTGFPARNPSTFSRLVSTMRRSASWLLKALCGVMMTLGLL